MPPLSPKSSIWTTAITATYDDQSNTHRIEVQWSAAIAGYIAGSQFDHQPFTVISPLAFTNGAGSSDSFTIPTRTACGTSLRSQIPTDFRSDWILDDRGVRQAGPSAQTSCNRTPFDRYAVSGPLILTAKPLSAYQRSLLTTIEQLKLDEWSDRQIAKYFNERAMLTPRGSKWVAQTVSSMRSKFQKRSVRISGK
jgi:hypothetical protein